MKKICSRIFQDKHWLVFLPNQSVCYYSRQSNASCFITDLRITSDIFYTWTNENFNKKKTCGFYSQYPCKKR